MALMGLVIDAFKFFKETNGLTVRQIAQYIANNADKIGQMRGNIYVRVRKTLDNAIKNGLVKYCGRRYFLIEDGYLSQDCGFKNGPVLSRYGRRKSQRRPRFLINKTSKSICRTMKIRRNISRNRCGTAGSMRKTGSRRTNSTLMRKKNRRFGIRGRQRKCGQMRSRRMNRRSTPKSEQSKCKIKRRTSLST